MSLGGAFAISTLGAKSEIPDVTVQAVAPLLGDSVEIKDVVINPLKPLTLNILFPEGATTAHALEIKVLYDNTFAGADRDDDAIGKIVICNTTRAGNAKATCNRGKLNATELGNTPPSQAATIGIHEKFNDHAKGNTEVTVDIILELHYVG